MLKVLNKTLKKIDKFQEDCSDLTLGLGILLGENVSISDIAVNKSPEKRRMKEATVLRKNGKAKKVDSSGDISDISPQEQKSIDKLKKRGYQINDDSQNSEDDKESEQDAEISDTEPGAVSKEDKKHPGKLRGRIIKTEKELEVNDSLRQWVFDYFNARRQGNFTEAGVIKRKIDSTISEKNLDRETVFFGADDVESELKAKEDKDKDEDDNKDSSEN